MESLGQTQNSQEPMLDQPAMDSAVQEQTQETREPVQPSTDPNEIQVCLNPADPSEVTNVAIDDSKESIILEGLDDLGASIAGRLCETSFPPMGALHVATVLRGEYGFVQFNWAEDLPYQRRNSFAYTNGLRSIAEYKDAETCNSPITIIFALMEQVRIGLNARTVFFVGTDAHMPTKIYMMENEPNLLLGINGEIGCGKSTVVEYISTKYGFMEYMFAQPLKEVAVCLGFEPHQVFGTQEQKLQVNEFWGISGRQFLQVFGSEVCRDYAPKVLPQMKFNGVTMWVRLFEKFRNAHLDRNIAVSDVRFQDESQTIKKYGGIVVRLVRTGVNVSQPLGVTSQSQSGSQPQYSHATHKSETQATTIKPNVIINNDRDLATLFKKLDLLMDFIRRGIVTSNTQELTI